MQRIKIGHLQGNWHLDLAKDKNRRSPGARAFLARDFARAIGFAKSSTAWHFCQVCSLICQVAQIANSKCKTVGYLFWSFLANYSNANLKCKTLGDALTFSLALFSFQKVLQNFSNSPSHRIFRHMHGVLNIDKNKN